MNHFQINQKGYKGNQEVLKGIRKEHKSKHFGIMEY